MKHLCFTLIAALSVLCCSASAAGSKPNVLFIFNDDQRADTIAALGNPRKHHEIFATE